MRLSEAGRSLSEALRAAGAFMRNHGQKGNYTDRKRKEALGRLRAFRHYVGLSRTERRLDRLLRDFSFGTLSEALEGFCPGALDQPQPARRAA